MSELLQSTAFGAAIVTEHSHPHDHDHAMHEHAHTMPVLLDGAHPHDAHEVDVVVQHTHVHRHVAVAPRDPFVLVLAAVTATFSLVAGSLLLAGTGAVLPPLLGG